MSNEPFLIVPFVLAAYSATKPMTPLLDSMIVSLKYEGEIPENVRYQIYAVIKT
jgi:hypothetical protein